MQNILQVKIKMKIINQPCCEKGSSRENLEKNKLNK